MIDHASVKCDGTDNCTFRATNAVAGDPCRGIYKYTKLQYACHYPILSDVEIACEGSTHGQEISMTCSDDQVIKVGFEPRNS